MKREIWITVLAGGMAWAITYNSVWVLAWFGFMRRAWADAAYSAGLSMPWTLQFWILWLPMTLGVGMPFIAYLSGVEQRQARNKSAILAILVLWLLFSIGMASWAVFESVSLDIILLDSFINLIAIALATCIGVWSIRDWPVTKSN